MWVVDVRGLEAAPHLIVRTHRDGRLLRAHDLRQPNRSEPLLFQPLFLSLTLSLCSSVKNSWHWFAELVRSSEVVRKTKLQQADGEKTKEESTAVVLFL